MYPWSFSVRKVPSLSHSRATRETSFSLHQTIESKDNHMKKFLSAIWNKQKKALAVCLKWQISSKSHSSSETKSAHFPMAENFIWSSELKFPMFYGSWDEEADILIKMLVKHQLTRDVWVVFQHSALLIRRKGRWEEKGISYQTIILLK